MVSSLLMGLHSGIPGCCILSYLKDERGGVENIALSKNALYGPEWRKNWEFRYVPCRRCWERWKATGKGRKEIHQCGPECGIFWWGNW